MSRWYRAYEGTVTDAKLHEAAMVAGVSRSVSIAAWHCLLESAAGRNNCGSFDATPRRIAVILCEPPASIDALFAAFDELGLIGEGAVASWKKRQFHSDDSKERVAKHRAKKRSETPSAEDVTACNGDVTLPEAETDSEKEVSSNDDRPSDDGPSLQPEHIQEVWNELAPSLARPTIRDLTPERRQLVRARIAQYSLDDFKAVFGKCRDSPFLRGDKGRTPLTFDWLMKKGNFQKTLEGNYDR
jgi:hypothetical protein